MKGKVLFILGCTLFSSAVMAEGPNTIRFQGEVAEQTCSVQINDTDTGAPIVTLPTVKKDALQTKGKSVYGANFTIAAKGCNSGGTATRNIYADLTADNPTDNGNLKNTFGGNVADKVSIQVHDPDDKALDFNTQRTQRITIATANNADEASKTLSAYYYAEKDNVDATGVTATLQYALRYN